MSAIPGLHPGDLITVEYDGVRTACVVLDIRPTVGDYTTLDLEVLE